MTSRQAAQHRYVLCLDNSGCPAFLEVRKVYRALPDAQAARSGMLRVIDESGEDYLYRSEAFCDRSPAILGEEGADPIRLNLPSRACVLNCRGV